MAGFAVILAAAGKSSRFKDDFYKKPFALLGDRPVWLHCAERFLKRDDVKQLIVVISPDDQEYFMGKFGPNIAIQGIDVVLGGSQRADSVENGLKKVRDDIGWVAIHDAARPCIADEWIDAVFNAAEETGAAILATPVTGTLKRVGDNRMIEDTVPRDQLWEAQTPQVAKREFLLDAFTKRGDFNPTDEAQLLERAGVPVKVVNGSLLNVKITTKQDLRFAGQALKALPKPQVFGQAHPFGDDDMWR